MTVVVGLGAMGAAVAACLVERGIGVVGVETDDERRTAFVEETRAPAVRSLSEVAWDTAHAAFVVVRTTDQAERVLAEIGAATSRTVPCFVLTTLDHAFAGRLGEMAAGGVRPIELPVSGGPGGARAGTLTTYAAGPLTDRDIAFLEAGIAATVIRFEAYGQPTLAKLVNNVTAAYNTWTLVEMLRLGAAHGLDVRALYEVLRASSGGSWMTEYFPDMQDDQMALLVKDVKLLAGAVGMLPSVRIDDDAQLIEGMATMRDRISGEADEAPPPVDQQ